MPTEFGRFLRKMRIDCGELTKDMALKLKVSPSYLSAVETGKRNIPAHWVSELKILYHFTQEQAAELALAADRSLKTVSFELDNMSGNKREAAAVFAREFGTMDDATIKKIREIMSPNVKGGN